MSKTNQNNTAKKKAKSITTHKKREYMPYFDYSTGMRKYADDVFLDQLADKLFLWTRDHCAKPKYRISLVRFLAELGYDRDTFYGWCRRHKKLMCVKKAALIMMADTNHALASDKKADWGSVKIMVYNQDEEFKKNVLDFEALLAKIKKDFGEDDKNITINLVDHSGKKKEITNG